MAKSREDLVGIVYVGEHVLKAGETVPEGVIVGDHVLVSEAVAEPADAERATASEEPEPEAPKRRPRTTKPKE